MNDAATAISRDAMARMDAALRHPKRSGSYFEAAADYLNDPRHRREMLQRARDGIPLLELADPILRRMPLDSHNFDERYLHAYETLTNAAEERRLRAGFIALLEVSMGLGRNRPLNEACEHHWIVPAPAVYERTEMGAGELLGGFAVLTPYGAWHLS